MELQTLDLSRDGEPEDAKAAFRSEVRDQCSKYGFVKFTGHGIEDDVVAEAFEWVGVIVPSHHRH